MGTKRKRGCGDEHGAGGDDDVSIYGELLDACNQGNAETARDLASRLIHPARFLDFTPCRRGETALAAAIRRQDLGVLALLLPLRPQHDTEMVLQILNTQNPAIFQLLIPLLPPSIPEQQVRQVLRQAADFPDQAAFGQLLPLCSRPSKPGFLSWDISHPAHLRQLLEYVLDRCGCLAGDDIRHLCESLCKLWIPEFAPLLWRLFRQNRRRFWSSDVLLNTLKYHVGPHRPGMQQVIWMIINDPGFDMGKLAKHKYSELNFTYHYECGMHGYRSTWIKLLMARSQPFPFKRALLDIPPHTQQTAMAGMLLKAYAANPDHTRHQLRRELKIAFPAALLFVMNLMLRDSFLSCPIP